MNTFRLRIYYEYLGRSHSDLSATQMTPDQVRDALNAVAPYLSHLLANADVRTEPTDAMLGDNTIFVTVRTDKSKEVLLAALAECVQKRRLLVEFIDSPS